MVKLGYESRSATSGHLAAGSQVRPQSLAVSGFLRCPMAVVMVMHLRIRREPNNQWLSHFVNTDFNVSPVKGSSQRAEQFMVFARICPLSIVTPTKQSGPLLSGGAGRHRTEPSLLKQTRFSWRYSLLDDQSKTTTLPSAKSTDSTILLFIDALLDGLD
jgi:hypothetical protein